MTSNAEHQILRAIESSEGIIRTRGDVKRSDGLRESEMIAILRKDLAKLQVKTGRKK